MYYFHIHGTRIYIYIYISYDNGNGKQLFIDAQDMKFMCVGGRCIKT